MLEEKYVVITGASSGIGYYTALEYAKKGKNLVIAARREAELEALKTEISKVNSAVKVIIKPVDLSVDTEVYRFYESLSGLRIETFVNNAGFGDFSQIPEQDLSKIQGMLRVNIEALTILSTLYVRDYEKVEGSTLINVASSIGYVLIKDAITYCATKFYVASFSEGLAQELENRGAKLKAKVLSPAMTETEFAKVALDGAEFSYENAGNFHTAEQMAGFLLQLHESDKIVGIVNSADYEFILREPILPLH